MNEKAFRRALFGAKWDLSAGQGAWARFIELRDISPELATGYYLSAIAAVDGVRESIARAELALGKGVRK